MHPGTFSYRLADAAEATLASKVRTSEPLSVDYSAATCRGGAKASTDQVPNIKGADGFASFQTVRRTLSAVGRVNQIVLSNVLPIGMQSYVQANQFTHGALKAEANLPKGAPIGPNPKLKMELKTLDWLLAEGYIEKEEYHVRREERIDEYLRPHQANGGQSKPAGKWSSPSTKKVAPAPEEGGGGVEGAGMAVVDIDGS